MSKFSCARWRAQMDGQAVDDAPIIVFQRGHVFNDGARVGTICQSPDHFIAGLDADTTLLVPLDQDGPDRYSAVFRIGSGDTQVRRPGVLIRERLAGA